jgi:branched-chain amino acid transport system ATP-binding protein
VESNILEIKGLSCFFGGVKAIDNVDFSVKSNELRCVIGPNGAGKSTLFKTILGTVKPKSGSVLFYGKEIKNNPTYKRVSSGIGVKFQNFSIYNDLTVEHNIRVSLPDYINQKDIKSQGQKILNRLGLQVKLSDRAGSLSHGHKQWLSIGMALAMEPKLLLLDEPTAGMGSEETSLTAELLKSLNSEGVTILVIEHDMAFVRELKAPITVLHLGKILAEGNIEDIENNPNVRSAYLGNN